MENHRFDLGFGNSRCVREAFMETVGTPYEGYKFDYLDLRAMDYPEHEGDPKLINIAHQVIRRQIGQSYKHVFITNGATGGVVIALRAYAERGNFYCHTRKAPWYGRYPGMIKAAGMSRTSHNDIKDTVILLDLPSNPLALMDEIENDMGHPVILDAVYYNNIYCGRSLRPEVPHDVLVGSFSKLFGINGIRLGWLATNDDLLAVRIKELVTAEYCGLSVPDAELIKRMWDRFNWEYFEQVSKIYLDSNREEWSKLERYFSGTKTPDIGMFYYAPMDEQCRKLMKSAGVLWTKGPTMGTSEEFGRFNVGQETFLIREVVKEVLKTDRAK